MTTQEKIEDIRKACIACNPEITELKFGCVIAGGDGNEIVMRVGGDMGNEILQVIDAKTHEPGGYFSDYVEDENGEQHLETADDWLKDGRIEVIGRPITLADILLAIGAQTGYQGKSWMIDPDGKIFSDPISRAAWNLLKTLEDQDPPTIDFIHEILK